MQASPINLGAHLMLLLTLASAGCGLSPRRDEAGSAQARVTHPTARQLQQGEALAGSYLVTFRPRLGEAKPVQQGFSGEQSAHVAYLDQGYSGDPRIKQIRFLAAVDLQRATRPSKAAAALALPRYLNDLTPDHLAPEDQLGSLAQVDFTSPAEAREVLHEWDDQGSLWFAEPNYISQPSALADTANNLFATYATQYTKQSSWWTNRIDLPGAFSTIGARDLTQANTPTDQEILGHRPIIAVFDSGVDYLHPALSQRIWTNQDPNVSGCTDDIHGCNTTVATRERLGNGDVWPYGAEGPGTSCDGGDGNCAHGTHVAGIIAGDSDWSDPFTGEAAAGVCPVCQIMILRIVGPVGTSSGILDSSIVAAFKYISLFRRNGRPAVRVVNASFGKFVRSRAVNLLLQAVKEQDGTLVIAAAGNEDSSTPEYPAAFHDAIGVAAVDSGLRKLAFSNFGTWVSLAAPGDAILSTVPGGALERKSGTSMAAPMVAATAGLLLARFPTMDFASLRGALLTSADPTLYDPAVASGFNFDYYFPQIKGQSARVPLLGRGLLNARAALAGTTSGSQPAGPNLNRVRPGCGVIAAPIKPNRSAAGLAWWWLLLPLGLTLRRRRA